MVIPTKLVNLFHDWFWGSQTNFVFFQIVKIFSIPFFFCSGLNQLGSRKDCLITLPLPHPLAFTDKFLYLIFNMCLQSLRIIKLTCSELNPRISNNGFWILISSSVPIPSLALDAWEQTKERKKNKFKFFNPH